MREGPSWSLSRNSPRRSQVGSRQAVCLSASRTPNQTAETSDLSFLSFSQTGNFSPAEGHWCLSSQNCLTLHLTQCGERLFSKRPSQKSSSGCGVRPPPRFVWLAGCASGGRPRRRPWRSRTLRFRGCLLTRALKKGVDLSSTRWGDSVAAALGRERLGFIVGNKQEAHPAAGSAPVRSVSSKAFATTQTQ